MKSIFTLLLFVSAFAVTSFSQTPYVEYPTTNFTLEKADRVVVNIRYIVDVTDPNNKKTYVFYQKRQGIAPYIPNVPTNWVTYVGDFEEPTELHFITNGVVNGIIDENGSYYIRIN